MTLTIFQTIKSTPCINMKIGAQSGYLNSEPEVLAKGLFWSDSTNYHTVFPGFTQ